MSSAKIRLAQCMAGGPFGGAEDFYVRLVCALANDSNFEQMAFTRANAYRVPEIQAAGVPVKTFRFGSVMRFVNNWRYRHALRKFQPDIVFTYMNRPSRLTPRGPYKLVCRLGHFYDLKHYRHADYWIGNCKGICQYLVDGGMPADRVVYIPNFVTESSALPVPRNSFATPTDKPLLLAAGRLHVNKAFDILLQSMVNIPDVTLWLAGDGPEKEKLHNLAIELGIEKRVRFLGWRDDVACLMRTADIFICPSRHEGIAGVVPEAWFNNCPVIATASQGPRELIEDEVNCLLSPVDDVEKLRANIDRVLTDKSLREKLMNNGKHTYETNYTQEIITRQYKDFFHRIMQSG